MLILLCITADVLLQSEDHRRNGNMKWVMSIAAGNEYSMAYNSAIGYIGPEYTY